jgi:subtilisin family serine protease
VVVETDQFRIVKGPVPNDPLATSRGAWGQDYPDQWYLKAVRWLKQDGTTVLPDKASLATVAVIDTGVDFTHPELMGAEWINPNPGARGDRIGWNFVDGNDDVRDNSGHGTHVAGVIAAASGNGLGIAGINPWARIMALKAMDLDGTGGSIGIAQAILYAADHGARVINLSVGGRVLTRHEQSAIDYAGQKGALVVVAAGNEGDDTAKYSPAGLRNVLAVSVVGPDLKRRPFSNWGRNVAIAAPGAEILSLRARRTDVLLVLNSAYKAGDAIVAKDYYRITGSSFATPIVAGAASLLFSINPKLTAEQVKRMLLQSARDIDAIGTNQFSGYGLLDIEAAVKADPDFFIEAGIAGVSVAQVAGRQMVRVSGTANADRMKQAQIEIGQGDDPKQWKKVGRTIGKPTVDGVIADLPAESFRGSKQWTLRVIVTHRNGRTREGRFKLSLG